jgi:murein L,D-transpeptidase YafK
MKLILVLAVISSIAASLVAVLGRATFEPLRPDAQADSVIIDKTTRTMTLLRSGQPFRAYAVSLGRGGLEGKMREGDNRTPDGRYRIDGRNPHSAYHLSLRISYPDASDMAAAAARGENPGGDIMIHGIRNGFGWLGTFHRWVDWTAGCVAVTNEEIEEIWRVVPDGTPVEIKGAAGNEKRE